MTDQTDKSEYKMNCSLCAQNESNPRPNILWKPLRNLHLLQINGCVLTLALLRRVNVDQGGVLSCWWKRGPSSPSSVCVCVCVVYSP